MRRWIPALAMLLVSLISYIDRTTLALLAPTILRDTGLSGEQYGYIVLAFSVAYMVSNPVWGRILDRAGLRRGMTAAVAWWTVASAAHAFAGGFWSFGLARAALGFGEGATFPGGLRAVAQTLPPEERGRGMAVAYSGGSLGAAVTPLIVTPIFVWWGWRAAFWFTGAIGAAWLAMWLVVGARPDVRKRPVASASVHPGPRWRDRGLWAFMFAYALGALPTGFVMYTAPLYLSRALGCSQEMLGKVLWIPPLGWELGYFVWGWLSDRGVRRGEPRMRTLGRLMAWSAVASLPFVAVPRLPNLAAVMGELFVAMFVASGFVVLSVAYATHVYSAEHSGLIAGAGAGSWSLIVGLTMPIFGRMFDRHDFATPYWIATAVIMAGYAGWWVLSRGDAVEESLMVRNVNHDVASGRR
jgi:MFS transporter, ACS family, hexuronate transporter